MPQIKFEEPTAKHDDLLDPSTPQGDATLYAAATDVRQKFSRYVDMSKNGGKMTLVTEHHRPAAALVSVPDYRILRLLEAAGYKDQLTDLSYESLGDGGDLREVIRKMFTTDNST